MASKILKYGGLPLDEQETTIRLDARDGTAHVFSSWPAWSRRFERKCGQPKRVNERDGWVTGAWWTVPLRVISIRSLARNGDPGRVATTRPRIRRVGTEKTYGDMTGEDPAQESRTARWSGRIFT